MNKNKKYVILGILGFVAIITAQLLIRMFFYSDLKYEVDLAMFSDHYYDPAFIRDSGLIYTDYSSVPGLYLVLLSCAFKVFGNLVEVIIIFNAILELIALIFIYFALRNIFGRIFAFIVSLILAAYPAAVIVSGMFTGVFYMLLWRDNRLLYLAGAIGLWIISLIIRAIKNSVKAKKLKAAEPEASEQSEEAESFDLTSDGLKEDEIEIIDDGGEQETEANTEDVTSVSEDKTESSANAESEEEEDYSKYYESDASLRVVLSEEGMVVEEYRTGEPDLITPDTVIASEHPEPSSIIASTPVPAAVPESVPAASPEPVSVPAELPFAEPEDEPVELLVNPLPGPKKHEHRDMDYDYDIDPSQMKYDIDTDDVSEYDYE